ncbi:SWR1-complex protein 4 [Aspergillus nomiae NRRL 13137]|uniref:SWR1-complex protein 4 n=1 Tax=Aspergillus nomiae NRRL (strain ATCC 15546 / NRRL 13137 / CBS 260.88 / M93) TaxID=1509407 RepID=A0A0L1IXA7_ASPN3|nr:SWR1-complex protein 4 [Aspergillus nomiae NRRL 13137]KNG84127.1 SWR1-complex protein 4 [Aspergillus nomiae NRRL 13137]
MAAADVRDMLDLPAEGQPRPHKKQKVVEKRPEGITRELYALLGERAPPIAINENRYKGRPKWMSKLRVRPWHMAPFTNEARSDGLVLRHWQRQSDTAKPALEGPETDGEEQKQDEGALQTPDQEYLFAKYNVKARVPRRYTDEEYNRHLKSDDWSRQETDYLMDLAEEYDLRWVIIADRYDFQPHPVDAETNNSALVPAKQVRTMEHMKARYYFVAASMLALEHPPSEMSEAEFDLHEKMMKFEPERERARKELAALQLERTADAVREEGVLLEELKRITANEQTFIAERRELYSRLEVPISVGNTTMYQSSQGLSHPAAQTPAPNANARDSRGETPSNAPAAPTNKKAAAAAAANKEAQQNIRTLTPSEEARYGVQHHDRLAPGVQFRSDRAQKLTQAKSNVQTQKLAAALAELEVPLRLVMPTERVCKEFEKLIHSVNLLLDARKVAEKVESEIRVLEAAKQERERKAKEAKEKEKPEVKTEQDDNPAPTADVATEPTGAASAALPSAEGQAETAGGTEDKEAEAGGGHTGEATAREGTSQKRSASVLSNTSDKSTKRQKK